MGVTIKDIAKMANVSITTVSRVINNKTEGMSEETRKKILDIVRELDYHPNSIARGLVTKKTNILGLILPDISNPFFPDIVRGVEDAANKYGYNIILCNTDDNIEKEQTYIKILKEKCVDGIIHTGTVNTKEVNLQMLSEFDIPYVLLDRSFKGTNAPAVYTDGEMGMYKVVKYLIENGHRDMAYISGPVGNVTAERRFGGYEKALAEYGISVNYDLVRHGDYKMKSGIECANDLLDSGKVFTAVICENDLMAVGALEALNGRGVKVPEDVSITGFDNIYLSKATFPKLTTVSQPTYEMGSIATTLLIKLINNESITEKITVLEPEIVIRDSVAKRGSF